MSQNFVPTNAEEDTFLAECVATYIPPKPLSKDRSVAMQMLSDIQALVKTLPGIDCGSCGSPTCRAFAADVIKGTAAPEDCVFLLRERLSSLLSTSEETEHDGC